MSHTLKAQHLKKAYAKRMILQDVSLHIQSGEIVGLLGPNGAGKTTSFYSLVGLIRPDAGEVLFDTQDITRKTMSERARLGLAYLPQESSIFRKLSVRDNLLALLELRDDLNPTERQAHCDRLLEEFRITSIQHFLGQQLSGGERRRVEIARMLTLDPHFVLLDEPFAGIDPLSISELKVLIKHLKSKNMGVLITDHNVRDTLDICNRAYILHEGQLMAEGSPQAIADNANVRAVYLGETF